MTTTFATRSEYRAYKKSQASITANKGRKITLRQGVAAFGLASFLIANAGVGAATAANTPTPYPTFMVSTENQATIERATSDSNSSSSKKFWSGGIQEISVSEADIASLAKNGMVIDFEASVALTNQKNADGSPGIYLVVNYDDATFRANNPEIAATMDISTVPDDGSYYKGAGLIVGQPDTLVSNITSQAIEAAPVFPKNVALASPPRYLDATHTSADKNLPVVGAFPTSSFYAGGEDSGDGTSQFINTQFNDVFANSGAARIADTNSNGQRGLNAENAVNCVIEEVCGFWITPAYSGNPTESNLDHATIAVGEPVWVSVKTTYAVAAIPEWTEENPFIDAEGNKYWFTPKTENFTLRPVFNAGVPLAKYKYAGAIEADLADAQERKITVSSVQLEGSALNVAIEYRSGAVSVMTAKVVDGSTPQEKVLTIEANDPQPGEDWFHNGAVPSAFFAGQSWTEVGNNGETVRFTVTSMDAGQIVITAVSDSTPLTLTASKAVIGTSVSTYGVAQSRTVVPTYEVHYLQAETPAPAPEPETPVVPAPEPEPETPVVPAPEPETPVVPEPETPVVPEPEVPVVPETPEPETPVVPEFVPESDSGEDEFVPASDSGEDLANTGAQGDVLLATGVIGGLLLLVGSSGFYAAKTRRGKHA